MKRTLAEWLEWQEQLHLSSIDLGLDRVSDVASRLQLTTLRMPVITVAGTNGKGSCVAMLDSIYRTANYRTGCYTSPHLIHYNERICIAGQPASDDDICEAFTAIDDAREGVSLTYFEFGTLAAAYLFRKHAVDVAIFEVGLGGRLDAVNLWDADIALISNIDIDHIDWLGDDREQIGVEKAGIMRSGHPVICGDPTPTNSIKQEADRIGATLLQLGQAFFWTQPAPVDNQPSQWVYQLSNHEPLSLPLPALRGRFQLNNAAAVVSVVQTFQTTLTVNHEEIAQGLRSASVIGRLQRLSESPEILADVAHNPQSAAALAEFLIETPAEGQTIALFSALADKDLAGIVGPLTDQFDAWHLIPLEGHRAREPQALLHSLRDLGITAPIEIHGDISGALNTLQNMLKYKDRVVAFGSFLVVSGVMHSLSETE